METCPHCYPSPPRHLSDKLESICHFYLTAPLDRLLGSTLASWQYHIRHGFLHYSEKIRQITFTKDIDRSCLNNSILVIWDEAINRNIDIYNVQIKGQTTQYFMLQYKGKQYFFNSSPLYLITQQHRHFCRAEQFDNKDTLKKMLAQHQLPCPTGRAFISAQRAFAYGMALGFPLVVKPTIASFSKHTSFPIASPDALKKAIRIAKQVNYRILVEKYISGHAHRVTILNNSIIASTKREAASVTGDGKKTISQLIDEKNQHPWRGEPEQLNCTLHKIQKNESVNTTLSKQQLTFDSIPENGQRIYLATKINNGNGADVTNATPFIHPENRTLFLNIHRLLNIPLSALDFICADVSVPWQKQSFGIIENNSLPSIDAHHFPSIGEPMNVAKMLWDFVLGNLST